MDQAQVEALHDLMVHIRTHNGLMKTEYIDDNRIEKIKECNSRILEKSKELFSSNLVNLYNIKIDPKDSNDFKLAITFTVNDKIFRVALFKGFLSLYVRSNCIIGTNVFSELEYQILQTIFKFVETDKICG